MALKVCSIPGCPNLQAEPKCIKHRREAEAKRGSSTARGYGYQHTKLRTHYQQRMDNGETFTCWRCARKGKAHPVDPQSWDLGHDDETGAYRGPECVAGNRAAPRLRGA